MQGRNTNGKNADGGGMMVNKFQERLEEILEGVANEYSAGGNYENAKPLIVEEAEQAIRTLMTNGVIRNDQSS